MIGSVQAILDGQKKIIIANFQELSSFMSVVDGKIDLSDPHQHPMQVVQFLKTHMTTAEFAKEYLNWGGTLWHTVAKESCVLYLPEAMVVAEKCITDVACISLRSSIVTAGNAKAFDFIIKSVEKFQNPKPDNKLYVLLQKVKSVHAKMKTEFEERDAKVKLTRAQEADKTKQEASGQAMSAAVAQNTATGAQASPAWANTYGLRYRQT